MSKKNFSIVPSDKRDFEKMIVYHEPKFDRVVCYIPDYADSTPLNMEYYQTMIGVLVPPVIESAPKKDTETLKK